ncbi:dethiobiotin synthase [Clostridium chromiireducens]|uniref:ATP-dependent dethiobiotin synthetase BioD n=1 Tax=Clostridium chromiireducens TaxID=225345 RepID=A0A1V4J0R7_9CLOT|nr:dethiobiotin synthase [Clostridium chromiireducens]OPJ65615.1 ATP-dependent dethiobiotin synthetase BioD 1 [Clostridium chromiireducens]
MSKKIFITATGTDIGKTFVTALIVKKLKESGYNGGYYKAALSGAEITENGLIPGDACYVKRIANINENTDNLVSYVYKEAVSPHLAAQIEGNPVEMKKVVEDFNNASSKYDYLVMEGSGGIVCPIRYDHKKIMLEDIIKELGLSTLIIADAGIGTINHVAITVEYLKIRNISIKGIILNNYNENNMLHKDNKKMIEAITKIPVIATVKENEKDLNISIKKLLGVFE